MDQLAANREVFWTGRQVVGPSKSTVAIAYGFSENLECGAMESSSGCAHVSLPVSCGQLCLHLARSALPTSGESLDLGGLCKDVGFTLRKMGAP